ncbi:NUDIX domain-containing protein [Anaerorhabdus sp.]|uniref:NUDIX domain-containing protein n=1 Tax=Anaerorhabdus sp. TaxID=1872524 RepID=UPI002FCB786B
MENWDAYDVNGNRLDLTLVRGEMIPEGVYHAVVIVIVVHKDGDFLLMQRSMDKVEYPGYYEPGASGSVLQFETPLKAAFRELEEETGILATNMYFIEKTAKIEYKTIYSIYYTVYSGDKNAIQLQEHETMNYKWIDENQFILSMDEEWLLVMFKDAVRFVISKMK